MKRQEHTKQLCESHPCVKIRAKVAVYLSIVDFLHATFALSPQKLCLLLLKELGFTDYLLLHTSLDYLSFCWWGTIKVYCFRCSNTVFFMNTGKKKIVLNKYISKKFLVRNVSSLNPTARASGADFYDNMDCILDSGFMKWMFDTTFPYCYPKLFFNFSYWPSDQVFDWFII